MFYICSLFSRKSTIKKADNFIYEGNTEFDNSNNIKAEKNYRRALSTGVKKNTANYNIANVLQEQDYLDEAIINYFDVISASKSKTNKHKSYHNIGNAFMENKNYKAAVEAYKNALRNNPADDESRYNYALAKKMLDDEQNKNDKEAQDKDQKDKDQKDKDQKIKTNRTKMTKKISLTRKMRRTNQKKIMTGPMKTLKTQRQKLKHLLQSYPVKKLKIY